MRGEHQPDLRMDVNRLDRDPPTLLAQALGDPVGGPTLSFGPRQPALERAELVMISMRPAASTRAGFSLREGDQRFGPMWRSIRATESRLATEMFQRFVGRHSTPTLSQYSQNR